MSEYNSMTSQKLKEIGFNYTALGHVHTTNYTKEGRIIYPGSLVSLGFDELGEHGMVVGNISKEGISTEFVKMDSMEFVEKEIDVNETNNNEEIIDLINNLELEQNKFYKIILIGNRKFNIDLNKIEKKIIIENIKGYFVAELLNQMENSDNKDEIKKAIEIGLEVLN